MSHCKHRGLLALVHVLLWSCQAADPTGNSGMSEPRVLASGYWIPTPRPGLKTSAPMSGRSIASPPTDRFRRITRSSLARRSLRPSGPTVTAILRDSTTMR